MGSMDKHVCNDALHETRTYRGWDSQTTATTATEYDALGRAASAEDRLGHATTYGYDAIGRKTSETDAADGETTFTYLCMCQLGGGDFSGFVGGFSFRGIGWSSFSQMSMAA